MWNDHGFLWDVWSGNSYFKIGKKHYFHVRWNYMNSVTLTIQNLWFLTDKTHGQTQKENWWNLFIFSVISCSHLKMKLRLDVFQTCKNEFTKNVWWNDFFVRLELELINVLGYVLIDKISGRIDLIKSIKKNFQPIYL